MKNWAAVVLLSTVSFAQGASPRHELAWRTQALEREWLAHPSLEERAKVLPQIEQAVQKFFAMDMAGVAAALDEARFALAQPSAPCDLERFSITPKARLLDLSAKSLELSIANFYTTEFAAPITLSARIAGRPLNIVPARIDAPAPGQTRQVELSLEGLPLGSGDLAIDIEIANEGDLRSERTLRLSVCADRDLRLAALRAAFDLLPDTAPALERETVKSNLALLDSLSKGSTEETDFPGALLLSESETMVASAAKGARWFGPVVSGQSWLTVPSGRNGARIRLFVPEGLSPERPVPLVVALHGAGGSENMFFDAYGDGRIVELCKQRGWMLAAPRVSFMGAPVAAVVDALAERYPIALDAVLLVGHSMGAGAGQQLVAKDPAAIRAFAALGGGSGLRDASALKGEPIFVGAGERDFGRRGAEALHKSLVEAGSQVAQLRIYPSCEHLMVVVDALPDVFAWFDAQLAAK